MAVLGSASRDRVGAERDSLRPKTTRGTLMLPNILEVGAARSDPYAGTNATVVALTPREKIHVAPSRAAEGGSALQLQS